MAVKHSGSTWTVDVSYKKKRFRRTGILTKVEAQLLEAQARSELHANRDPLVTLTDARKDTPALTLGYLLRQAERTVWHGAKSTSQYENALRAINHLGGFNKDATAITERDIHSYIEHKRQQGRSGRTLNKIIYSLKTIFSLYPDELESILKTLSKLKFKEEANSIRYFTCEEEADILEYLHRHDEKWYCWFILMLDTGARNGELAKLLLKDVEENRLTFNDTKNKTSRTIPLTNRAIEAVVYLRKLAKRNKQSQLCYWYDQGYLNNELWPELKIALGKEDDKDFTPYKARHTCATRLVQSNVDLGRVQKWLGHKRIATTLKYAHYSTDDLDICISALENK